MRWSRLTGDRAGGIDLAVLRWCDGLTRSVGSVWVSVAEEQHVHLRRDLALVGVGLVAERPPEQPGDLVLTIARDLRPLGLAGFETIDLERVPLDQATRAVLGRALLRRASERYRAPREHDCRELLRGRDVLAWWERRAWLPRDAFRHADVRACFRPVIFDREAIAARRPGGRVAASTGSITRWAFA